MWPDPLQTEVLRAALAPGSAGVDAWTRLRPELDLDDIWDPEIHRLLPLVYTNLVAAGADDPDLPRLKGLYRRTWYQNQMRLHQTLPWIDRLVDAGISVMALKGLPLALRYYGDLGRRPMADIDVMVPVGRADDALDLLEAEGWRDMGGISRQRLWRRYHGSGLRHPSGAELDLHWYLSEGFVLPESPARSSDELWQAAQPFEVEGRQLLMPAPADMVLHLCVHGAWSGSAATVRWVADVSTVLAVAGAEVDWRRLVDLARSRRLVLNVAAALGYLVDTFDAPVPPEVLAALDAEPTTRRERRLHRAMTAPIDGPEVLGGLPHTRAYWAHTRQHWSNARALREAPGFLEDLWELDRPGQIPPELARKAWRRTIGRRDPTPARRPGAQPRLTVVSHPAVVALNQSVYAELLELGWDVELVVPARWRHEHAPGLIGPDVLPELAGRVTPIDVWRPGSVQRHLYRANPLAVLRRLAPDVVLLEEEYYSLPAAQWGLAARLLGIPFGVQADENLDRPLPAPAHVLRRVTLTAADFVTARSPTAARLARRFGGPHRSALVPHPIPLWDEHPRRRDDVFTVGFAGRLVREKGLEDLVAAVGQLRAPVRLLVAGDGPDRGLLYSAAPSGAGLPAPGLELHTDLGHEGMPQAYAEMDVLVLPSRTTRTWAEQFGRVLAEAQWFGVPVIGTDSGAIGWVIDQLGGGLVVPEGDPTALADAIAVVRDDPRRWRDAAAAGRSRVVERFGAPAVAARLDRLLRQVAAQ